MTELGDVELERGLVASLVGRRGHVQQVALRHDDKFGPGRRVLPTQPSFDAAVKALDLKLIHACKPSAKARAWIQLDLCDPAPIRGMHPPCVDDLEHVEPTLIPIAAAVPGWDTEKDTERDTYAWFTCDFRRLCSIYHHCLGPPRRSPSLPGESGARSILVQHPAAC